jgi:hypothetical protein
MARQARIDLPDHYYHIILGFSGAEISRAINKSENYVNKIIRNNFLGKGENSYVAIVLHRPQK